MAGELVVFVPGFACTQLYLDAARTNRFWINAAVILGNGVRAAALAANGIDPAPDGGRRLYPGTVYPEYYDSGLAALRNQLRADGRQLVVFPYDWRLSAQQTGRDLASYLLDKAPIGAGAYIVGHSFGGLVGRVAYGILKRAGAQDLVQRLVTLGTPHLGTYYGVQIANAIGDFYQSLIARVGFSTAALIVGNFPLNQALAFYVLWARQAVTWPSVYESFPFLSTPPDPEDPNRPALYYASRWVDPVPSQAWLDYARNTWQPLMTGPDYLPPPARFTAIAGTGLDTSAELAGDRPNTPTWPISSNRKGDSIVTVASAAPPGARSYTVWGAHADLVNELGKSGDLYKWLFEDVTVDTPASSVTTKSVLQKNTPMPPGPASSPAPVEVPTLFGPVDELLDEQRKFGGSKVTQGGAASNQLSFLEWLGTQVQGVRPTASPTGKIDP